MRIFFYLQVIPEILTLILTKFMGCKKLNFPKIFLPKKFLTFAHFRY